MNQISSLKLFVKIAESKDNRKTEQYYRKVYDINYRAMRDFKAVSILPINKEHNLKVARIY